MTRFQFVLALGVFFLAGACTDSRGQATATIQVIQAAGQEISAHAFPGNDSGAKIQAVIGRICDQGGWSAPSLSVSSGVNANAGGIKHGRTAINNCPASGCEATVTWGTAFANAEYTVSCTLEEPVAQSKTAGLRLAHIRTKTASAITVDFDNLSAGPASGTCHCIAMHD